MSKVSIDTDTAMFGWGAPFDLYDPLLPVSIAIETTHRSPRVVISEGCKLSTLIAALQARGMAKPGG